MLGVSNGQIWVFIYTMIVGGGIGLLAVLNRNIRLLTNGNAIITIVVDFVVTVIFSLGLFVSALIFNYGHMRWFIVLAYILGCYLGYKLLKKIPLIRPRKKG